MVRDNMTEEDYSPLKEKTMPVEDFIIYIYCCIV